MNISKNKAQDHMKNKISIFGILFVLFSRIMMPRYDARLQLLAYQVKILKNRLDDIRICTTEVERTELMRLGALIDHNISDTMLVVQPGTYHRWRRKKTSKASKRTGGGRPETDQETISLILRFAKENLSWGYKRILGELKKLGIEIGLTTIRDILKRKGQYPILEKDRRKQPTTWSKFISSHMQTLLACDFFTKPVYTLKGRIDAYVLVFIHLGSRQVFMSPPTFSPDEKWVLQQARNASMWMEDLGINPRHLILDRDTKFSKCFHALWQTEGVECIKTPVQSPRANSFCECFIGKTKRECLNHFIYFSTDQLDYINREWLLYYHTHRPHQGKDIGNKVLIVGSIPTTEGEIRREERLGGILAWYERDAA